MANTKPRSGKKYGRNQLSNGVVFDHRVNGNTRIGQRLSNLINDYAGAMKHTASSIETDMLRSAGVLQATVIDDLEHTAAAGGKMDFLKYRTALNTRDMLLRRCGIISSDWHHPDAVTEGTALAVEENE